MPGGFGDAHAEGARARIGIGLLELAQAGLHPGDEHLRLGGLGHRQDHQELVAAQAADHVERAALLAEDAGDLDEQTVARGVPHGVVHHLEAVQVQQQDARVQLVAEAAGDLGREPLLQRAAVVEAGQLVGGGGAVELLDQLASS